MTDKASGVEVLDVRSYRIVNAAAIHGKGRPLSQYEQEFISRFADPYPKESVPQIAVATGVLERGPIQVMVRFADGREAGVRLLLKS